MSGNSEHTFIKWPWTKNVWIHQDTRSIRNLYRYYIYKCWGWRVNCSWFSFVWFHKAQFLKFKLGGNTIKKRAKSIHNKNAANRLKFTECLEGEDWSDLVKETNSVKAIDTFYNIMNYHHDLSFPKILINDNRKKRKYVYNNEVIQAKKEINTLQIIVNKIEMT